MTTSVHDALLELLSILTGDGSEPSHFAVARAVEIDKAAITASKSEKDRAVQHTLHQAAAFCYQVKAYYLREGGPAGGFYGYSSKVPKPELEQLREIITRLKPQPTGRGCPVTVHQHHSSPSVEYGGVRYQVEPSGADAIAAMVKSYPQPVGLTEILGTKPGRVIERLPNELKGVIGSSSKGYRITV